MSFLLFSCLNDIWWFRHRVLNSVAVRPTYVSKLSAVLTVAWCNCREPSKCPLKGECLVKDVVYQATVSTAESLETYVGLTATEFKTRWRNHQMSFKHENKRNDTELSKHLWLLKDQKKDFSISWKILAKAKSYTNLTKRCNLCNTEKFYILYKPDMATLNKRNELLSTCRHKRKFLLKFNRIPKDKS